MPARAFFWPLLEHAPSVYTTVCDVAVAAVAVSLADVVFVLDRVRVRVRVLDSAAAGASESAAREAKHRCLCGRRSCARNTQLVARQAGLLVRAPLDAIFDAVVDENPTQNILLSSTLLRPRVKINSQFSRKKKLKSKRKVCGQC